LASWADEWLIKLNINRCMSETYELLTTIYLYYINIIQLEELDSIKDFDVSYDCRLIVHKLIDDKISEAYSWLGIIKRNFYVLSKDAFITLYKPLVRSHLEYMV